MRKMKMIRNQKKNIIKIRKLMKTCKQNYHWIK